MISVVIPTLNAERTLAATLTALVPAAVDGVVRELIVVDGGSTDRSIEIAEDAGAVIVCARPGRGTQLAAGAARAKFEWLLFLHADCILDPGWYDEAARFMRDVAVGATPSAAGAFRFVLNDRGFKPRALEQLVKMRCALFGLPYGDQGLLISRQLFEEIGGYRELPIMEDVDIVQRLGRRRMTHFSSAAVSSAERYRKDGYVLRSLRNQYCLALYWAGVSTTRIQQIYAR